MKEKIHNIGKGIKKIVDERIQACKELLSSAQNRLILGLIIFGIGIGLGSGLIASAYLSV